MKNQTNETMTDLTATVKAHWDACLDVNDAWCDFTNKIGVENTLFDMNDDLDWLVDLFEDDDRYEGVDREDLAEAVEEVAATRKVPADLITSTDLQELVNDGYGEEDVAEAAREAGVDEAEVAEFEADPWG